jgi:hypothetical protein
MAFFCSNAKQLLSLPMLKVLYTSIFCFFFFGLVGGNIPALEREITLSFNNEPLKTALNKIEAQTELVFSYASNILQNAPLVSLKLQHKTVREALALMLPKNVFFKAKNNYIILKEKTAEKPKKVETLSGYVYDKTTNKKLANVTLYDKKTLQTVTTDQYGFYSIKVPKDEQCLTVNKENYRDTCVSLTYLKEGPLNIIPIHPIDARFRALDSIDWRKRLKGFSKSTNELFKRFKGYVNTINVRDTIGRNFQISMLPFIGTNGMMSGNVYNKYSINVFGGYSRGTNALELGGFFNVTREKVRGAQLAGFFNLVGDTVQGTQLAGFFNVVGRRTTGLQGAGFFNLNFGTVSGLQAAGFVNINNRRVEGLSLAGFTNLNRSSFSGLQAAGFLNLVTDTLEGLSLAGACNLAGHSKKSVEVAGLFNNSMSGENNIQLAGLFNNTKKGISHIQIAGLVNHAHHLSGLQLACFNFVDTASGLPIGLLSFVKKGVHQIEVSADEIFYTNLSLRTGVSAFHNMVSFGFQPGTTNPLWQLGYGLGTSFKIKNKLRGDVHISAHHISKGNFYFATSELYKIYAGLERRFSKNFSIAAGPTFNLYWSDALLPDYASIYKNIAPPYANEKKLQNNFNIKTWIGLKVALRFF